MTFRRDAVALILSAIAIVIVVVTFAFDQLVGGVTERVEREQYEQMEAIVSFNMRSAEDRAIARAEMTASTPCVREAMTAQDRPRLLRETREMFRIQRARYGVDQGQFYLRPAVSFLRLHDPERHGDSVASFRPMVVATNQDGVPRKGFSISRRGVAIFGIVPVRDMANRQVGSFELGMSPGPVLDRLKAAYGLELALFIDEQQLRDTATDVGGDVINDRNRVGRYIKVHATNWDLMRQLIDDERLVGGDDPVSYAREVEGTTYGVMLIPLISSMGRPLGVIAATRDFNASRVSVSRGRLWQGLIALLAILLLCGVVLVVVRGLVVRPVAALNEGLAALARGDTSHALDDTKLSAEMARAVRNYEAVRARMGEGEKGEGS
jgi:methyl-accepting chemotaxis protein